MNTRERIRLDAGWKFRLASDELSKPYERWLNAGAFQQGAPGWSLDDSNWRGLDLPHDFVIKGGFVEQPAPETDPEFHGMRGFRPVGVGWYRKRFHLPESDQDRRIYVYFDGVFRDCRVYLNEYFIGQHTSGYSSFFFDVTDIVKFGAENLLVVRADANRPEGWFYEGGGIYRHVWLIKSAPLHIPPDSSFVHAEIDFSTPTPQALLHIQNEVANHTGQAAQAQLVTTVFDPDNQVAGQVITQIQILSGETSLIQQQIDLEAVRLWSLEQPNLYRVVTTIQQDGQEVDRCETTTGIRSIRFDPQQGFFLNEQPVKIKGVCCHQDHAGVGSAFPDRLHAYRLEKLKALGCNAYRCAHHPPAPELLEAADRLGMLVMDEKRRLSSAQEDQADLTAIIRRDRNHPSVILWSIGNEEIFIQWTPQGARIARSLQDLVHKLDPTRLVTLAVNFWNGRENREEPLENTPTPAAGLDVMGFNYAVQHWEGYHALHPHQPMIISEASTNFRTRGVYQSDDEISHLSWDDPRGEHRAEEQWAKVARYPYLSGTFIWTGFDYHGEPAPFGWPSISSQFGILDLCGFPKDNAYYFQAGWRAEPLVHIFPHWNWPDKIGQPVRVGCYTNCEEVELFVNSESQGRKRAEPNRQLVWDEIIYQPGVLEAAGYRGGQIAARARVETSGAACAVQLVADQSTAARGDGLIVDIAIVDAQGRLVPTADHRLSFQVTGGTIIGVGNGDPSSHEPEQSQHRRAFNGHCQVIVRAAEDAQQVQVSASAAGLQTGKITVPLH